MSGDFDDGFIGDGDSPDTDSAPAADLDTASDDAGTGDGSEDSWFTNDDGADDGTDDAVDDGGEDGWFADSEGAELLRSDAAFGDLTEDERAAVFDHVYASADPERARAALEREWGAGFDDNAQFAQAAMDAVPGSADVVRILEFTGLIDHPVLLSWLAGAGRMMAGVSGDATTIPQEIPMTDQAQEAHDDALETIRDQITEASARGNHEKADKLYQRELQLIARRDGDRPIVGGRGGPTA